MLYFRTMLDRKKINFGCNFIEHHKRIVSSLAVVFSIVGSICASDMDIVRLKRLIEIQSVSSNIVEVNRAVDFLSNELGYDGLWCQIETMSDGRRVLFAANEKTCRPNVLLSAHIDVVPATEQSQFIPRYENGRIYGRGASDCKEHVVLCARIMRELKGKISVGTIFGSDEEIGGASTVFMLDKGYGASKIVIVLDSEQYMITTRQKGLARYVLEKKVPPTHSGMIKGTPPNALQELIQCYDSISAKIPGYEDGTWRNVMTLERISGTRRQAEMEICVRCAKIGGFAEIENLLRREFGCVPRCLRKGEAVLLDETQQYLVNFREYMRRKWPERKVEFYHLNSSTDARHLQRLKLPMLILGVDARGAHTATEYVNIASIDEYADLIEDYLINQFIR